MLFTEYNRKVRVYRRIFNVLKKISLRWGNLICIFSRGDDNAQFRLRSSTMFYSIRWRNVTFTIVLRGAGYNQADAAEYEINEKIDIFIIFCTLTHILNLNNVSNGLVSNILIFIDRVRELASMRNKIRFFRYKIYPTRYERWNQCMITMLFSFSLMMKPFLDV